MADNKRFIRAHIETTFGTATEILIDRVTGVNYLFHKDGYGSGLTVLLDKDGKPVVTPAEQIQTK